MNDRNKQSIERLRARIALIEAHPDLNWLGDGGLTLMIYAQSREELAQASREIGGKWHKEADGGNFNLRQEINGFPVLIWTDRSQVCTAREVEEVLPATPEQVIPAQPERVVKKLVWDCPDSILRNDAPVTDNADGLDAKLTSDKVIDGLAADIAGLPVLNPGDAPAADCVVIDRERDEVAYRGTEADCIKYADEHQDVHSSDEGPRFFVDVAARVED